MSKILNAALAVVDIGKNAFHVVGQDERGAIFRRIRNGRVAS